MVDKSDIEKLQVLLPHWIEHSQSHQDEFAKWVELVRSGGHEEIASIIEKALLTMKETDTLLRQALEKSGGPAHGHHHHHHD